MDPQIDPFGSFKNGGTPVIIHFLSTEFSMKETDHFGHSPIPTMETTRINRPWHVEGGKKNPSPLVYGGFRFVIGLPILHLRLGLSMK